MAYPPQLPAVTRTDSTLAAVTHAKDHNQIAAALRDLVAELGASPSGGYANTAERIAHAEAELVEQLANERKIADAKYAVINGAPLAQSPGKNLFDKNAATVDKYWGQASSPATLVGHVASVKIPVVAGATYTIQKARNIQFFNDAGAYVSGSHIGNVTLADQTVTVPATGVGFIGISTTNANVDLMQLEAGAIATAYEPYGVRVQRLLVNGAYLDEEIADLKASTGGASPTTRKTQGLKIVKAGDDMVIRYYADETRDVVEPLSLARPPFTGAAPMVMYANSVTATTNLVPATATDAQVFPAINGVTATSLAGQGDDNAPIYADWSYAGGNHGWYGQSTVTMTGHGKTNADRGSRWTSAGRVYTLLKVIDANNVLMGHDYTVNGSGIVIGSTLAPSGTMTHTSGATNTATINAAAAATSQMHPSTHSRTVTATLDGEPIRDGSTTGTVLTITETYTILSFKALIDHARANIGADPFANIAALGAHSRVSNTYRITATGKTVFQTVTAIEPTSPIVIVSQAMPVTLPAGGTLEQMIPGVGIINGADFRTFAPLAALTGDTTVTSAQQLTPADPPNRIIQWAKTSAGARAWGQLLAILPIMDGKPATRKTNGADGNGWFIANSTKKNYPRISSTKVLAAGQSVSGAVYRRFLVPATDTPEQLITDGARQWVTIDTPDANASRKIARVPTVAGRKLTVVGATTVTPDRTYVDGEGITYVNTAPGYLLAEAVVDTSV